MIDPAAPDYTNTPASPERAVYTYAPAAIGVDPAVTIVTPFYNTSEIFHETARCVLRQSLQQWEWLIVNDGSTDLASLRVLDHYRHFDSRISIIDQPTNSGPAAARNRGYGSARAPYILQLDSDNLLEPTALEKWLWYLETTPEHAFVKGYTVGFGASEYLWRNGFHDGSRFLEQNVVDATSLVRKSVHSAAGGYDENIRDGLEDWDFWLRCADSGHWGGTTPEFLDWYRRRTSHADRWLDWDYGSRQRAFRNGLRQRYKRLWQRGFPRIEIQAPVPGEVVRHNLPFDNRLKKKSRRLLMVVPWLTCGGSDRFNLDAVRDLRRRGWDVTIAATLAGDYSWMPRFTRLTPDVFALPHFLRLPDYPRFLRYLIRSRSVDVVLISHSELGYQLLPYLRAQCPDTTFIDYCHIEESYWKNGGYPRMSLDYREQLDLTAVSSQHLRGWMIGHGGDAGRIEVAYTNLPPDEACLTQNADERHRVRRSIGIDDEAILVLFVGRISAQKQPRLLARVARRLVAEERGTVFVVAGDGPDMDWLSSYVQRQGLSNKLILLGSVSNARVGELMRAADIFFLPSQWEGVALSAFEAMSASLPVVSANVGGQAELITADCGVLVDIGDEAAQEEGYVHALSKLIRDPELRRSMGRAGHDRLARCFNPAQMSDQLTSLLQRAVRLHAREPQPCVPVGLARVCASQAMEYARLSGVADRLWALQTSTVPRHRIVVALSPYLERCYSWGIRRGWHWLPVFRSRMRRIFLQH